MRILYIIFTNLLNVYIKRTRQTYGAETLKTLYLLLMQMTFKLSSGLRVKFQCVFINSHFHLSHLVFYIKLLPLVVLQQIKPCLISSSSSCYKRSSDSATGSALFSNELLPPVCRRTERIQHPAGVALPRGGGLPEDDPRGAAHPGPQEHPGSGPTPAVRRLHVHVPESHHEPVQVESRPQSVSQSVSLSPTPPPPPPTLPPPSPGPPTSSPSPSLLHQGRRFTTETAAASL